MDNWCPAPALAGLWALTPDAQERDGEEAGGRGNGRRCAIQPGPGGKGGGPREGDGRSRAGGSGHGEAGSGEFGFDGWPDR